MMRAPAEKLYGEVPATFPTIAWQVETVKSDLGKKIDVALLTGGANDIGFDAVINPRDFPGQFLQRFEGEIASIAYAETLQSIARVRSKCPKAIIMLFGYFAPISYSSHVSKIRSFFKHELNDDFGWWINKAFNFVDVEAAIREGKIRSVWAASRAQHWMRAAVTEANRNDALRGAGVLFVPSAIDRGSSAFANNPKVAADYKHPATDPAQADREKRCPRADLLKDMQKVWYAVARTTAGATSSFDNLLKDLKADGGPASLIAAMTRFKSNPGNTNTRAEIVGGLQSEIHRIQRALIASFLHPNASGAAGYASIATRRYQEHLSVVSKIKATRPQGPARAAIQPSQTLDVILRRFGLRGPGSLLADIGHLDIDAIFLTIVTARLSEAKLTPDISLMVETQKQNLPKKTREYVLNFPYYFPDIQGVSLVRKIAPDFEPATTTLSSIDTLDQLRLEDITAVYLRVGQDPLAGKVAEPHGTTWRPRRVEVKFNGVPVIDVTLQDPFVGPGGTVQLNFPPTPSQPGVLAPV
ncbi:hypothetical protein CK222_21925 [Mesorhizobium sp. WSM3866]|uniref:hypothetical protein n=1 Tax=Mesorhizobium sp. WSM3866 TaxID=422271 RepID=UPI000BAFD5C7|nr:hypothetical protein [Mesorhizobium sp. WSM3866]PBB41814.1 hypothetical protein CK222_21925 [Mesorhizobium sp. WSM3866]